MTDTAELIARLRDEAGLKRDCNVCDGDGIKESGRPCGGCNQTGSVLVYSGRVGEMMTEAADALSSLVRERDELAERVDRMHGAEELLTAQNIIVRAVWDVLGGEDATRADGQNLIACVREITARATAAEAERDSWRRVSERLEGEKIAAEADAARMRKALAPFAAIPPHGTFGGPLVGLLPRYEDGSNGDMLGHEPVRRARASLSNTSEGGKGE